MPDNNRKYDLIERIRQRGVTELVNRIQTLTPTEIEAVKDDSKIGLSYIGDLLSERKVPNSFILHRLPEQTLRETLLEAVQTEEELDHVAAATDELDATLDVITKDPSDEVIAFYEKRIHSLGTPQKDVLQIAEDFEQGL